MALRNQRHAFEAADANGDGELDFSEYLTMMPSHIRNSHSEDRFRKWFAQADRDGKGTISRSEFFMWSLGTASRKFGNDGLLAVFRRYDANNSGSIDMAEFTRVVEDMGWDAKTAEEAFGEMPVRRDGTVDYLGLLAAFCDSKEGAGMSALEQLTVSMAWDAPKRSLRPDDVGVFDAPDSDTLRTQLRDVLQRNEVKGVEGIFPRVEDHMDVREFQRGLQNYVFYTGPAAVLCEAFQSLDTCGAGKVGLFELNEWLGMRKLPDEEALRLEAREVLSSCAKHKALPGDVVRAFASWGNPANHKAMQLMTSRAAGLGAAGARRGTFTRKSGSCVAAALAAAATKGKPCDLTIEKQVFLKRTRRHVDNDKRWFGGLRSHFSMILGMLQRDEDDAVSVVEISMWLDGTPLHPPKGVLDGGNSQRSQLIINGEVADTVPFRWVSGIAGLMLTQPVDYVLTRMQSGRALLTQASTAEAAGGLRGLVGMWRGIGPLAATLPINNAMLMYGYGVGKNFSSKDGGASLWPVFLGGCAGGFVQSFLQSPVELLKVRLQLAALGEVPSTSALTLELLRPATATAGLNATLLRDVVPHGVWFAAYEWSKKGLERRERAAKGLSPTASSTASEVPLSTPAQLAAGSFAAFAAWVVGYPADLLKTRCQMIGGPSNISEAARMVYAEGGVGAFYSGLGLKLLRAVPMSAVGFFAYEHTMALLAKRHER